MPQPVLLTPEALRAAFATPDAISETATALSDHSANAGTLVFVGTGGLMAASKAIATFAGWNIPGLELAGQSDRPRTRFIENADPATLQRTLFGSPENTASGGATSDTVSKAKGARLDLRTTRFVVHAADDEPPETDWIVQAILAAYAAAGMPSDFAARHLLAMGASSQRQSSAHQTALQLRLASLGIVFAAPSSVPALPSALAPFAAAAATVARARGLDPYALVTGGEVGFEAALQDAKSGRNVASVKGLLTVSDRLTGLAEWWLAAVPSYPQVTGVAPRDLERIEQLRATDALALVRPGPLVELSVAPNTARCLKARDALLTDWLAQRAARRLETVDLQLPALDAESLGRTMGRLLVHAIRARQV